MPHVIDLPGFEEAKALGYHLGSYAAMGWSADYFNGKGLTLTVRRYEDGKLTGVLTGMAGLVILTVAEFQFPHPRFQELERQIMAIIDMAYERLSNEDRGPGFSQT